MVARFCLAGVAVLAAAWLGLSLRNDQLVLDGLKNSVYASVVPSPGPAKDRLINRTARQLHDAQLLNPDRTPAVYEALVRTAVNPQAGRRQLLELSRSDPGDAFVWAVILRAVSRSDPLAARARAHLAILIPQRPR